MEKVIIASNNPVKFSAVSNGFEKIFPLKKFNYEMVEVSSGVPAQPKTDMETYIGARNRALEAKLKIPHADYWVGVEGGITPLENTLFGFAWVFVLSSSLEGKARTGIFELPKKVCELIQNGMELGDADDIVFGTQNSKQANGAVGLLTGDAMTRASFYTEAVVLALIPFKNQDLY